MSYKVNPFDVYLVEENTSAGISEKVRLYNAVQCIKNKNYNTLPESMVELAGVSHLTNTNRDPQTAIKTSVKLFRTSSHLEESWKTMGKLIEVAVQKYGVDLTEELNSYKPEEISLLEVSLDNFEPVDPNSFISNTVAHDVTYTSKTKYSRSRKDTGMAVKIDYPIEQPVDIWKGETMPIDEELDKDSDDPCWDGYVQLGTKMKNGKEVPNCVPIGESIITKLQNAKASKVINEMKLGRDLTSSEITQLKKMYEPFRNKRISPENARKLDQLLSRIEDDESVLRQLYAADIPFVSEFALSTLISKHNYKARDIEKITESKTSYTRPITYNDHLNTGMLEAYGKIYESTVNKETEILTFLYTGGSSFQTAENVKKEVGDDSFFDGAMKSLNTNGFINQTSKGVGITRKGVKHLLRKHPELEESVSNDDVRGQAYSFLYVIDLEGTFPLPEVDAKEIWDKTNVSRSFGPKASYEAVSKESVRLGYITIRGRLITITDKGKKFLIAMDESLNKTGDNVLGETLNAIA